MPCCREATFWAESAAVGGVETLYFGGGTPSLLPIAEAERLIDGLRQRFDVGGRRGSDDGGKPGERRRGASARTPADRASTVSASACRASTTPSCASSAGSTTQPGLRTAYRAAREAGFDSVSIDLIFGLPGQTTAQWRRTLEKAVALGPDHLSLYALTLEEDTPLARRVAAGECAEPDPDAQADMYTWSSERLAGAGYEQYEISNWSRPGHRCRHNLTYWHAEPYLGLGAGAHSYVNSYRLANERAPARYIELADAGRGVWPCDPATLPHVASVEEPDAERELSDAIILGLRLTEGVSTEALELRFGVDVSERYRREIGDLEALGLLESLDGRVRLTKRGRLLGNEAFQRFLP